VWKWWYPLINGRKFVIRIVDGYIVEAKELGRELGLITVEVVGHWTAEK
jgi:hypothetical protein